MAGPTQQWIVGVDTSSDSLHALRWALGQAGGHDGVVIRALYAIEPSYYGFAVDAGGRLPIPTTEMEELAAVTLEASVNELVESMGLSVDSSIAIGPPAAVMLEAAKEADVVVVGSRGRGGFASLLLGSVSHQLAIHAEVPTVVVPADAPAGRAARVAVGVDGSANARAALEWACEFADPSAEIVAVGVWRAPYVELQVVDERSRDSTHERYQALVAEVAAGRGREIDEHFITGNPRHELVNRDLGADLVVVGARGYDGIQGALIGSVATWVVHHAPCAVAIVPGAD